MTDQSSPVTIPAIPFREQGVITALPWSTLRRLLATPNAEAPDGAAQRVAGTIATWITDEKIANEAATFARQLSESGGGWNFDSVELWSTQPLRPTDSDYIWQAPPGCCAAVTETKQVLALDRIEQNLDEYETSHAQLANATVPVLIHWHGDEQAALRKAGRALIPAWAVE